MWNLCLGATQTLISANRTCILALQSWLSPISTGLLKKKKTNNMQKQVWASDMILFFLFFSFGECPVFDLIPVGATEITSPSYPGVYPDMLNCTWTVYSSSGNKLKAVIKDFVTEDTRDCIWDCLSIYDGPHLSSRLLGRLNSSLFVALLF